MSVEHLEPAKHFTWDSIGGSNPNGTPATPKYYSNLKIQPIDAIEAWDLGFNLGNVIKYVARAGKKPDNPKIKDLKKALDYLQREISNEEEWLKDESN